MIKLILLLTVFLSASCLSLDSNKNSSNSNNDNSNQNNDNSIDYGDGKDPKTSGCSDISINDGTSGFLWKPISDSNGNLAILLPADIDAESVSVILASDLSTEQGVYSGKGNPDRPTYRFSRPGAEYTGEIIIVTETDECELTVPDPSARQD